MSAKAEGACLVMSGTSGSITRSDAVGMTTMGAVPACVAAERVLDAADPKSPFPEELAVGSMGAVPARAAAERVLNATDPKPPFPGELTVGFPGESKAPTVAALMVHETELAIGGLLAVDSGKKGWRKEGG